MCGLLPPLVLCVLGSPRLELLFAQHARAFNGSVDDAQVIPVLGNQRPVCC